MFEIREFNHSDKTKLLDFITRVFNENDIVLDLNNRHADLLDPKKNYKNFFLAICDGKIIGISALRIIDGDKKIGEMKRLYLLKEFHGVGIGQALIDNVIASAQSIGLSHVRCDTKSRFNKAIQILEKNGFYLIERYNNSSSTHFYEKLL